MDCLRIYDNIGAAGVNMGMNFPVLQLSKSITAVPSGVGCRTAKN